MAKAKKHPLEVWRFFRGYTLREVADKIEASTMVVRRAEAGRPIRRKYIDKLLRIAKGHVKRTDFKEAPKPKGKASDGGTSQSGNRKDEARAGSRKVPDQRHSAGGTP